MKEKNWQHKMRENTLYLAGTKPHRSRTGRGAKRGVYRLPRWEAHLSFALSKSPPPIAGFRCEGPLASKLSRKTNRRGVLANVFQGKNTPCRKLLDPCRCNADRWRPESRDGQERRKRREASSQFSREEIGNRAVVVDHCFPFFGKSGGTRGIDEFW